MDMSWCVVMVGCGLSTEKETIRASKANVKSSKVPGILLDGILRLQPGDHFLHEANLPTHRPRSNGKCGRVLWGATGCYGVPVHGFVLCQQFEVLLKPCLDK